MPLQAGSHSNQICVDGLLVDFTGWTEDGLARSGLAAAQVTVARTMTAFEDIVAAALAVRLRVRDAGDRMHLVLTGEHVDRIGDGDGSVGVIMGIQNTANDLKGDPRRVELLWELGIRVIQPTYNFGNALADGCIEARDAGLTLAGRGVVRECNRLGLLLDVSHLGTRSALEIIAASELPVVATHANRRVIAPALQNKEDSVLKALAEAGGVVGVSPWGPMSWSGDPKSAPTAKDFVAQVVALVELLGADAVAIGSCLPASPGIGTGGDFGAQLVRNYPEIYADYTSAFGAEAPTTSAGLETLADWPQIPAWLGATGLSEEQAAKVLGRNWLRIYRKVFGV